MARTHSNEPTGFLTIREVARLARLHESTVRSLVARGELPGVRFGRVWRIPRDKWELFLSNQMAFDVGVPDPTSVDDPDDEFIDGDDDQRHVPFDEYDDASAPEAHAAAGTLGMPRRRGERHVEMDWK